VAVTNDVMIDNEACVVTSSSVRSYILKQLSLEDFLFQSPCSIEIIGTDTPLRYRADRTITCVTELSGVRPHSNALSL
jgi:hypothetical protein